MTINYPAEVSLRLPPGSSPMKNTIEAITRAWQNLTSENGATKEEELLLFRCGLLEEVHSYVYTSVHLEGQTGPVRCRLTPDGGWVVHGGPDLLKRLLDAGLTRMWLPLVGWVDVPTLTDEQKLDLEFGAEVSPQALRSLPDWARRAVRDTWDAQRGYAPPKADTPVLVDLRPLWGNALDDIEHTSSRCFLSWDACLALLKPLLETLQSREG